MERAEVCSLKVPTLCHSEVRHFCASKLLCAAGSQQIPRR
jgi:hypothetical protein